MKPSSKILLRVAAILPVVAFIAWQVYHTSVRDAMTGIPLVYDCLFGIVMGINMFCIALACFVIYHQRSSMPEADKPFRIVTYIAAGWMAFCLLLAALQGVVLVNGICMLYIPVWMRAVMVILLSTWLWMLSNRQGQQSMSKPLSTLFLCGGMLSTCLLVLIVIAGVYVLYAGHVYNGGLGTYLYYHWIRYMVPIILLGAYAISFTSNKCKRHKSSIFVWLLFAISICIMAGNSIGKLCMNQFTPFERGTICIDYETQSILDEEMQKTIETTSPKWASAIVMAVPSGVVMATYSSDSVEHFRDTLELGSLTIPLQLLEAIRCSNLDPSSIAEIHKEGIVIDGLHYYDSHPRDTTFDIADIIAASSQVGAATLLSQSNPDVHGYLFNRHSTMMDVADEYCYIADDLNRPRHDRNMFIIQKGLHDVVWNNKIGTASVRQWEGNIVAYKAQSDSIHIAGKTGAIQVYRDGERQAKEHRLSFIGYFPEEAPTYCCLVVIDTPSNYPVYDAGYDCGGTIRRIAERIYKKH